MHLANRRMVGTYSMNESLLCEGISVCEAGRGAQTLTSNIHSHGFIFWYSSDRPPCKSRMPSKLNVRVAECRVAEWQSVGIVAKWD